jgi:hypothetical protein
MSKEVTIDLETLDTPGSKKKLPVILSIGACVFDSDVSSSYEDFTGEVEPFKAQMAGGGCFATEKLYYSPVSLLQSMANGFTISADTAKYWDKQSYNMVEQAAGFREKVKDTFVDFARWLKYVKVTRVWANSPSFDTTLLRDAFDHVGLELDIYFRDERDVRTGTDLMEVKWPEQPEYFMKHHALCDAIVEARLVQSMYAKRRFWKSLEAENETLRSQVANLLEQNQQMIAQMDQAKLQFVPGNTI